MYSYPCLLFLYKKGIVILQRVGHHILINVVLDLALPCIYTYVYLCMRGFPVLFESRKESVKISIS